MKRGDMVTIAVSGDYGKPRPALIVQADAYAEHPSLTVLPLTSELVDAPLLRVTMEPSHDTGLRLRSRVMVDKATTIPRGKTGARIGQLDEAALEQVNQALRYLPGCLAGSAAPPALKYCAAPRISPPNRQERR